MAVSYNTSIEASSTSFYRYCFVLINKMSKLTHTPLSNIELCYDGVHTPLTRTLIADLPKNEKGHWHYIVEDTQNETLAEILSTENSSGHWIKFTRDKLGNVLTYEDSEGCWNKSTRDSFGNVLTYEDSKDIWQKYTRDSEGNLIAYEDKNGLIVYLTGDDQYGLYYQDGLYKAGCRFFTYEEAIAHWTQRAKEDYEFIKARAIKFLAAIEKHQQGLKNATNDSHSSDQH